MSGETAAQAPLKTGRFRWSIVALLFIATTVNYIDRTMLGLLAPSLEKELGWNENDYGNIVTAFQAAYALGFLAMGWLIDRFGPLPPEADQLLKVVAIKGLCREANVSKIDVGPKGAVVTFRNDDFKNPAGLVGFIAKNQVAWRI
eukprot:gene25650-46739_t